MDRDYNWRGIPAPRNRKISTVVASPAFEVRPMVEAVLGFVFLGIAAIELLWFPLLWGG